MPKHPSYDAVVVGAGPNGLAAAVVLAQGGRSVLVVEANERIGGGARTAELTLPGYRHDVCSAIHPMAVISPLFQTLPLADFGLEWIHPPAALAHPLDEGTAAMLEGSLDATAAALDGDAAAYRRLFEPFVRDHARLFPGLLGPLRVPEHPVVLARFGMRALRSASSVADAVFKTRHARALFAGCAAHSFLPFDRPTSAAIGLVLMLVAHVRNWPFPRRGSDAIVRALGAYLDHLGGEVETGRVVRSLDELPRARAILFDLTPSQLLQICGERLPVGYRRRLEQYRHGPGIFKLDWALDGPIPWKAASCTRAG